MPQWPSTPRWQAAVRVSSQVTVPERDSSVIMMMALQRTFRTLISRPLNSFDHGGVAGVLGTPVCAFTAADSKFVTGSDSDQYYRAICHWQWQWQVKAGLLPDLTEPANRPV